MSFALRPDAQAFDKVEIVTVPRYKTSGLSGDEWRISAEIRLYRKGKLVSTTQYRDVETACSFLPAFYLTSIDNGLAYYAGDGTICDQEGCDKPATIKYRKRFNFCREGHKTKIEGEAQYRCFCDDHKVRGDCGLDDSDDNYARVQD